MLTNCCLYNNNYTVLLFTCPTRPKLRRMRLDNLTRHSVVHYYQLIAETRQDASVESFTSVESSMYRYGMHDASIL